MTLSCNTCWHTCGDTISQVPRHKGEVKRWRWVRWTRLLCLNPTAHVAQFVSRHWGSCTHCHASSFGWVQYWSSLAEIAWEWVKAVLCWVGDRTKCHHVTLWSHYQTNKLQCKIISQIPNPHQKKQIIMKLAEYWIKNMNDNFKSNPDYDLDVSTDMHADRSVWSGSFHRIQITTQSRCREV